MKVVYFDELSSKLDLVKLLVRKNDETKSVSWSQLQKKEIISSAQLIVILSDDCKKIKPFAYNASLITNAVIIVVLPSVSIEDKNDLLFMGVDGCFDINSILQPEFKARSDALRKLVTYRKQIILRHLNIYLDIVKMSVKCNDQTVQLPHIEFLLLKILLKNLYCIVKKMIY